MTNLFKKPPIVNGSGAKKKKKKEKSNFIFSRKGTINSRECAKTDSYLFLKNIDVKVNRLL